MSRRLLPFAVALLAVAAACRRSTPTGNAPVPMAPVIVSTAPSACEAAPAGTSAEVSLDSLPIADPLVTFDSAWTIVYRSHWDTTFTGVDWRALRDTLRPRAAEVRTTGEMRRLLGAMIARLGQSHFSVIPREQSDATPAGGGGEPAADRNGTVGLTLRLVDSALVVTRVAAGGPAERAGVRPGHVLESVNGCAMAATLRRIPASLGRRQVALAAYSLGNRALAGPAGDTVTAVFRDERDRPVAATMVRIREPGVSAKFGNLPAFQAHLEHERRQVAGRSIGVIRFNIWMPVLAAAFDAAIDSLRDADAIVLDLRGNFGGVGGMSMGFAGHFLDSTVQIGTMRQRSGDLRFIANPRRVNTRAEPVRPFAGPVALVVDELSISTTEIFAGGMQAVGRSRVFGVQTAGQALPSVAERLPNGDILYHAIADFLNPKGKPLEGDGVTPDVVTPVTRRALVEGKDPALDAALAWAAASATRASTPEDGASP
jgi:carboxyl-terminal processing protease